MRYADHSVAEAPRHTGEGDEWLVWVVIGACVVAIIVGLAWYRGSRAQAGIGPTEAVAALAVAREGAAPPATEVNEGQGTAATGELLFGDSQTDAICTPPLSEQDTDPGKARPIDTPGVHLGGGAAFSLYGEAQGSWDNPDISLDSVDPAPPSSLDSTIP